MEDDRLRELESRLEGVVARLGEIETRLAVVEEDAGIVRRRAGEAAAAAEAAAQDAGGPFGGMLSLLGRTLLVFGGAYLLRALTDNELLPRPAGILVGLAYALVWLVAADRAAGRDRRPSGVFHGVSAVLIGYPLLWEAATRFAFLTAAVAAGAITLYGWAILAVAARRRLQAIAWLGVGGGAAAALALIRGIRAPVPSVAAVLALALAALWVGYGRSWKGLPWLGALAADLGVVIVAVGFLGGRFEVSVGEVVALEIALFAGYVGSFAGRTLLAGRQVGLFEVVQGALAVLVGFYGAIRAVGTAGTGAAILGVAGVLLGAGCYAVAFTPAIRHERRRNFLFYTTLALLLVLVGSSLLLTAGGRALAWSALAVLAAWLSGRLGRVTLSLHSTLYLLAAAFAGGLLTLGAAAYAVAVTAWPPLTAVHLAVALAIALGAVLPVARTSESWGRWAALPRLATMVLAVWGVGGALLVAVAPALAGGAGGAADPGRLAMLRTAWLAAAAVLLAWAGRLSRFREASWLVYPLLGAASLVLLAQGLRHGSALDLFLSLGALGGALLAAARLRRPAQA
jgi:hypothetical protein